MGVFGVQIEEWLDGIDVEYLIIVYILIHCYNIKFLSKNIPNGNLSWRGLE